MLHEDKMSGIQLLQQNTKAKMLCCILEECGYRAFAVGGCVRDSLMGISPNDIDITTSAEPNDVRSIFEGKGYTVIDTGIKHGTVTVIVEREPFEITTMRVEGGYSDNRHPSSISFVKEIESDLSRRDFTMNAIAYSYFDNSVIDVFDGISDIKNGIIRCVGDPSQRFDEDALRILRALRFASKLGFSIDEKTRCAMIAKKDCLRNISAERIYKEFCEILCGKYAGDVIYEYSEIVSVFVPEIKACKGFDQHSKYHVYDVLAHICKVIDSIPPVLHLRLTAFFHDIGKPQTFFLDSEGEGHFYSHACKSTEICDKVLGELRADKKTKANTLFLVKHHDTPLPVDRSAIKKRLNKIGENRFFDLITVCEADCKGQAPAVYYRLSMLDKVREAAQSIIDEGECLSLSKLAVDGNDIISIGVQDGRQIGFILSKLLDSVLAGEVENSKDSLLKKAKNFIEN